MGLERDKVLAAMQAPFPALTDLQLWCGSDETAPVIPDTFLGGSAPLLQSFTANAILYPGLPKLLSSATHLAKLQLWDIPDSTYISPEAMATCLSASSRLEQLSLQFRSS
jgi:hypothetical protein